ncbi:hypothetical protein EDD17DRAFT_1524187, partial [Pisolithus thermaeus]
VFDLLLTRDLSGGHVIDFNPRAPHTDPLLFTYEEPHKALTLSGGRNIMEFSEIWREEVTWAVRGDDVHALTCACLFFTAQKGLCSALNRDFSTTSNKRTLSSMEWKAEQTCEMEG